MNKQAVVFGAYGGIGLAVISELVKQGYAVHPVGRAQCDFNDPESNSRVSEILAKFQPSLVVNCAGHFDNGNTETHRATFDINVGSNWSIIQHYINNGSTQPVHVIMVGSSAYKSGRRAYILYAASKAAIYNMWQGASDYFAGTDITVSLINPVRTRTPMIDMTTSAVCLDPEEVAQEILRIASTSSNQLVDMKYPEEN